ncbi:MAG: type ISP restriction/modification enzyme [Hyphomonadaceae bacterium]
MAFDEAFQAYLKALRETPLAEKTEHTDRDALKAVLRVVADASSAATHIQHEPKRAQDKGAPDFKVSRQAAIIGYVEVKQVDANLAQVLKSDQINRYVDLNPNILVTDYLRFIWIKDGKIKEAQSERLCEASAIESKQPLNPERVAAVAQLLTGFFKAAPKGIKRASELAGTLAVRSRLLRDFLTEELERQEKEDEGGKLLGLFKAFKEQVSHELTIKDFADAFAQTLAYGLFLAKLNVKTGVTLTLSNADEHVPGGFSLIRELVGFLKELDREEYRDIKWVVEEVLSIVNWLDVDAVREDLSFKKRRAYSRGVRARSEEEWRLFSKDPFVYFYEDYLAKYDSKLRKSRGVYYTPPPIVNFIVRAINDILKDTFEIEQGLADRERVTVLDFACGTGTFLVEVLERIFDEIGGPEDGRAPAYVREHILKNIYGFEYLIAPYTIAHLKLSQYLSELAATAKNPNIALKKDERFQVFLTNTLEPIEPQRNYLLPELTHETEAAQAVKDKTILVITGNPPYAGHSKNKGKWISQAVGAYRKVDGKTLPDKNPKWLQDDYVKFIRFAQMKMAEVDEGVVGVITNHSYLDNPTFRGMRQSLRDSFDQIWIVDLHGSLKPKEPTPDGVENDNVFDIQKGVSILLCVKRPGAEKGIWFSEFWGTRQEKYQASADGRISTLTWRASECFSPYHLFRPMNWAGWDSYSGFWPLADSLNDAESRRQIFETGVLGFQSHRDHFAIAPTREEMTLRVRDMIDPALSDGALRQKYEIDSNRDWKLEEAREALRSATQPEDKIIRCAYRLFDSPFCYFGTEFMDYPRRELVDHVANRENVQLVASRQIGTADWRHAFVAVDPANDCLISDKTREANQVFPLWLHSDGEKRENIAPEFRTFIDGLYSNHYTPEQILGYIYAILHAPTYRSRYAEFLRIDFPRIPFAESSADFEKLFALGAALVEAHLLRKMKPRGLGKYQGAKQGEDQDRVLEVRYAEAEQAAYINDVQRFAPIPPEVWTFHIGGYQVLDKYLKSRKTRLLSLDEIEHVAKVADVLAFTIEQMAAIDDAYQAAFPQQA